MPKKQIREFVKELSKKASRAPHIAEVVEHVIRTWGGPEKFAISVHDEFHNAKPGSMTRARMLDSMMRLMQVLSAQSGSPADEAGLLTDAELEEAARSILGDVEKASTSDT
jgi:hypothetical protein